MNSNVKRMILGGTMLVVGWLIIMAAVLELIPQWIWLGFLAYTLALLGFVNGIYGAIMYVKQGYFSKRNIS